MIRSLSVLMLLGACQATVPVPPVPADTALSIAPAAPVVAVPTSVALVTQQYHAARRREIGAVVAPDVTAEYVSHVHSADRAARSALTVLERQGRHVTATALVHARDAVSALSAILSASGQTP